MSTFVYSKNFMSPWPFPTTFPDKVKVEIATTPREPASTAERLKELGAKLMHLPADNATAVYRPTIPGGRMYEVAFAHCHSNDSYNKKIGADIAISRFEEGKTVLLPLGQGVGPQTRLARVLWNIA